MFLYDIAEFMQKEILSSARKTRNILNKSLVKINPLDKSEKTVRNMFRDGLNSPQAYSLGKYLDNSYKEINKHKWGKKQPVKYGLMRSNVDSALRKLPKYNAGKDETLKRVISIPDEKVTKWLGKYQKPNLRKRLFEIDVKDLLKNPEVKMDNFTSTTKDLESIPYLSNPKSGKKITYNIKPKSKSKGVDVSRYNPRNEQEVLYPLNTRFKVKRVKNNKNGYDIDLIE